MSNKNKSRKSASQASPLEQTIRVVGVFAIIIIIAASALLAQKATTTSVIVPSATVNGSPTAITFPTIPSGGTPLTFAATYIHPSGIFSVSQLSGWAIPPNGGEETTDQSGPAPTPQNTATPAQGTVHIQRAGVTFINGNALSVVYAYVEHDSTGKVASVQDLDKTYDKTYFDAAWGNFTSGYKETSRSTANNLSTINFTLGLNGVTYLGRQISQVANGWIKTVRLVTPNNNPDLIDNLQKIEWPTFQFYTAESNTPLTWPAIVDPVLGYVFRYEPGWAVQAGAPGQPFVASGLTSGSSLKLTTQVESGKLIGSEADVRAWVKAQNASATVQTVQAATINGATGFNVSYQSPDADGTAHSAVSTLLVGSGKLYSATFVSSAAKVDLLGTTGVPPDLATMRNTFLLIPSDQLVPTLTPTITPTASITPTGADTLTAAANMTNTALATTAIPSSTITATPSITATSKATGTSTATTAVPATTAAATQTATLTATTAIPATTVVATTIVPTATATNTATVTAATAAATSKS